MIGVPGTTEPLLFRFTVDGSPLTTDAASVELISPAADGSLEYLQDDEETWSAAANDFPLSLDGEVWTRTVTHLDAWLGRCVLARAAHDALSGYPIEIAWCVDRAPTTDLVELRKLIDNDRERREFEEVIYDDDGTTELRRYAVYGPDLTTLADKSTPVFARRKVEE